jgi:MYXO-CTERM domain-containing protein
MRLTFNQPDLRIAAVAVVAAVLAAGPARAFYFDFGPGSGISRPKSLIPDRPDDWMNPPGIGYPKTPPPEPPEEPEKPHETPEPGTGIMAALGLAALAARRLRTRRP